jgi:hypothetical protein
MFPQRVELFATLKCTEKGVLEFSDATGSLPVIFSEEVKRNYAIFNRFFRFMHVI